VKYYTELVSRSAIVLYQFSNAFRLEYSTGLTPRQ